MAVLSGLSNAHAILLATHLCASGNVAALPLLHARFPTALRLERLLRIILTFLPESTEPQSYTSVLQALVDSSPVEAKEDDIDVSSVKNIEVTVAQKRVRKLHLLPLRYPADDEDEDTTDPLTQFLIHRAHRIDTETGLQTLILDLLLPFYQRSETIRTWLISVILPLLRLNYEYYPDKEDTVAIETIESMDDQTAINVLLSITGPDENNMDLARNLRGLVGAWMYGAGRSKRRKLNQPAEDASISVSQNSTSKREITISRWQDVNEWLLSRSLVDYDRIVGAFANWNGPDDVDLGGYEEGTTLQADEAAELKKRYGQTGLAAIYANPDTSRKALGGSFHITKRVAQVLGLEQYVSADVDDAALPTLYFAMDSISSSTRASLLQNNLLVRSNPLTVPTPESVAFMNALLVSLRTLDDLGRQIPCRSAANICLHSNDDGQLLELRGLVETVAKNARPGRNWVNVRQQVLWLRDWGTADQTSVNEPSRAHHGLFWRVSRTAAETEILKAMLATKGPTDIQVAVDIYTQSGSSALSPEEVESAVKEAIFTAYDNASNGNKTRGGIKRATEILQAFRPHFPSSTSFKQIDALIAATHALSFYSLKLQHGVPFQPVSIRVHPDPIYLIEKVLEQNPKSYTKLDDLLSIGRNLVAAGLVPSSNNESHPEDHLPAETPEKVTVVTVTTERRIISLAVSSALSSNDFGTAYSYILTRLTPPSLLPNSATPSTTVEDDISWRAAYNAGRHRSATQESPSPNLQSQIAHLSQRMELLSLALVLAPPEPLPEILGAWRRCDEEISVLHTRENDEAELWDLKGDKASLTAVPGGFGPTDTELDAFENEQQRARRAHARRDRTNRSMYEEAPMGLFDVARGAARAISKNAFPLHSALSASASSAAADGSNFHGRASEDSSLGSPTGEHDEGRVRKRDMVSNMVTGGLATGIGWVLGAQPVNR